MQTKAPNIFTYATKELSQDAFLCWLLSFAKPEYRKSDFKDLHLLAMDLLYSLTNDNNLIVKEMQIIPQKNKIDIWIEITTDDSKKLIIIEDKTNSKATIDQLSNYYKFAKDFCDKNGYNDLFCVYLKTGNEAKQVFEKSALHENWQFFSLENLMKVLDTHAKKIAHPFFHDFYEINYGKQQINEGFEKHIKSQELEQSKNDVIQAFYARLEKDKVFTNWDFSDSAGYRKHYSNDYKYSETEPNIYLQLDKLSLVLKIDLRQMKDERGKKYKKFQEELKKKNIKAIFDGVRMVFQEDDQFKGIVERPAKLSVHNFLTFGKIEINQWIRFDSEGNLNYEETKKNIENIKSKVNSVIKRHRTPITDIIANGLQQPVI